MTGAPLGRCCSADILVCGFWGLSSPEFVGRRWDPELESSANPQAGKPTLRTREACQTGLRLAQAGKPTLLASEACQTRLQAAKPALPGCCSMRFMRQGSYRGYDCGLVFGFRACR